MRTVHLEAPASLRLGLRHDDTLIEPAAPRVGQPVTLSLWARADARLTSVELRCAPDGEEELHRMEVVERRPAGGGGWCRWACTIGPRVRRMRYRFRLDRPDGVLHLSMGGISDIDPLDGSDFTLLFGAGLPDWPLDAVLYQIFPDRFDDGDPGSNVADGAWSLRGARTQARPFGAPPLPWSEGKNLDFCGGDLAGIERRLDYLGHLGVTGLFLNPIWPALSNHRYDLIDHGRVDPHLGGDSALASLTAALRRRDMRVVLDVILNHTGSGHPWFNRDGDTAASGGAYRDPSSPTRDHYVFDEWPHRYRSWFGIDTLPRLNLTSPAVRDYLFAGPDSCLRRFLRPPFSVDGYRFDVANMMGRDGETQHHRELWSSLRAALRAERPDAWLVGEHFFDGDKLLKGDALDGVMAYQWFTFPVRTWLTRRDRRGSPSALDAAGVVSLWREAWARAGWAMCRRSSLHVNTHDLPRLQTLAGPGGGRALDVATALQLALPGTPCLYYGDEIGVEGGGDPDNRRCMVWDEDRWDRPRLDRTRALIARRRASPALRRGGFLDLGSTGDVVAFARVLGDETRLVVASRSDDPLRVVLPTEGLAGYGQTTVDVELAPRSAVIL